MAKGTVHPSESRTFYDRCTGTRIRQVTAASALHHHPFFIIPAYDDAMQRLIFVSYRTGTPQIFAEERATGELRQLTDRPDLGEWSVHPSSTTETPSFSPPAQVDGGLIWKHSKNGNLLILMQLASQNLLLKVLRQQ